MSIPFRTWILRNCKIGAIETITLDEFYSENKLDEIDILKLDVQGSELDILKGSKT